MTSIFISYARDDRPHAEELAKLLADYDTNVWWDYELKAGERYRDRIEIELLKSDRVIVLWSEASVKSDFVRDEARHALEANKYLGISLKGVKVPLGFGEVHTITSPSVSEALPGLIQAIGLVKLAPAPAPPAAMPATATAGTTRSEDEAPDAASAAKVPLSALDDQTIEALITEGSKEHDPTELRVALKHLKDQLDKVKREGFSILLVGRAGVGKSSTINKLLGNEVAKVGDWEATTKEVATYQNNSHGVQYTIYDTPGLCDNEEAIGNDFKYLDLIRKDVKRIDILLFVTQLNENRVRSDERNGIRLLYNDLGPQIWKHSVLVFTYSSSIKKDKFEEAKSMRAKLIREVIAQHIGESEAAAIPAVFIDNSTETLPDGSRWLGNFYVTVVERMQQRGHAAFELLTKPYSRPSSSSGTYNGYGFSSSEAARYEAAVAPSRQTFWGGVKSYASDTWNWVRGKLGF